MQLPEIEVYELSINMLCGVAPMAFFSRYHYDPSRALQILPGSIITGRVLRVMVSLPDRSRIPNMHEFAGSDVILVHHLTVPPVLQSE